MAQAQIASMIRGQCLPQELARIGEVMEGWRKAVEQFRRIEMTEQEAIVVLAIPTVRIIVSK